MTELELAERSKLEEDTLCSLPFESQYKMRRTGLDQTHIILACERDELG
jgi:hypothetical protein